jgi:hypothetical protein
MMHGGESRRVKFSDENRQNNQAYVKSSLFDDDAKQGTTTYSATRSNSRLSFNSPIPVGRSSMSSTPNINSYSPRPTHDSFASANYSAVNTPSSSRYAGTAGRTPRQPPLDSSAVKERQSETAQSPFAQFSGSMNSLSKGALSSPAVGDSSLQQGASPMPERSSTRRGPMGPPLRSLISPGLLKPSTSYSSMQFADRDAGNGGGVVRNGASQRSGVETLFQGSSSNTPIRSDAGSANGAGNSIHKADPRWPQQEQEQEQEVVYPSSASRVERSDMGLRQRHSAMEADCSGDLDGEDDRREDCGTSSAGADCRRRVLRFDEVDDILLTSSRQGKKPRKKSICTQVMEYFFAF